jgi:hypothetical protein
VINPAVGQTLAQAASTTAYQNDGWYLITGANQAATLTQSAGIATGSLYSAKVQRNNGQTGTGVMRYAAPMDADEIANTQGNFVALSCTVKEGANQSFSHALNYALYAGTGAVSKRGATPYTGETAVVSGTLTTSTTATRFTVTSAAIVPTTTTQMELQFNETPSGTAGADDSFYVDDCQIEPVAASTSAASPYRKIDYHDQLSKAARFMPVFNSPSGSSGMYVGQVQTTTAANMIWPFQVPMRVPPTGIVVSNVAHFGVTNVSGGPITTTSITFSNATIYSASMTWFVAAGLLAGNASQAFVQNAAGQLILTGGEI